MRSCWPRRSSPRPSRSSRWGAPGSASRWYQGERGCPATTPDAPIDRRSRPQYQAKRRRARTEVAAGLRGALRRHRLLPLVGPWLSAGARAGRRRDLRTLLQAPESRGPASRGHPDIARAASQLGWRVYRRTRGHRRQSGPSSADRRRTWGRPAFTGGNWGCAGGAWRPACRGDRRRARLARLAVPPMPIRRRWRRERRPELSDGRHRLRRGRTGGGTQRRPWQGTGPPPRRTGRRACARLPLHARRIWDLRCCRWRSTASANCQEADEPGQLPRLSP